MNWKHAHDHPHGDSRGLYDEESPRGSRHRHRDELIGRRHDEDRDQDFATRSQDRTSGSGELEPQREAGRYSPERGLHHRGVGLHGGAEPARGYGGDYESLQRAQPPRYGEGGGREQTLGFRGRGPKNYTRSDERIREDISERLWDEDDVDASDVSVEVRDGVVSLSGNVEQRWIKHRIEDIADSCGGVRDIRNDIRVQSRSDWPYDKQVAPDALQGARSVTEQAGGGTMSALDEETPPRSH